MLFGELVLIDIGARVALTDIEERLIVHLGLDLVHIELLHLFFVEFLVIEGELAVVEFLDEGGA